MPAPHLGSERAIVPAPYAPGPVFSPSPRARRSSPPGFNFPGAHSSAPSQRPDRRALPAGEGGLGRRSGRGERPPRSLRPGSEGACPAGARAPGRPERVERGGSFPARPGRRGPRRLLRPSSRGRGGAGEGPGHCPPPRPPAPPRSEQPGTPRGGGRLRDLPAAPRALSARPAPASCPRVSGPGRGQAGDGRSGPQTRAAWRAPRGSGSPRVWGPGGRAPGGAEAGAGRDSCGRAGIFSLNRGSPPPAKSPVLPLPPWRVGPERQPLSRGSGAGRRLQPSLRLRPGQRTFHRGPRAPGLGSSRGGNTRSREPLRAARSPQPALGEGKSHPAGSVSPAPLLAVPRRASRSPSLSRRSCKGGGEAEDPGAAGRVPHVDADSP